MRIPRPFRFLTPLALSVSLLGSCSTPLEARRGREPVPELSELDAWLAERESRVPGLKPGVEAGIVWAHPARGKTPLSIVYLPGYTATRGEISPAPERIAAALGANLFFERPTGQGMGPDGHRTVRAADWVADGLEALEIGGKLGDRIIVMATSTGAALATWLVLGPSQVRPAASILVSPNLTPANRQTEMLLWPGSGLLLQWMMGDTTGFEPKNELNDLYWDTTHHTHSLIPMMQLVEGARQQKFSRWPTPVLVVYDPEDNVVDESVTVELFSKAPADKREFLEWKAAEGDDHHVLAGDALSPGGTDRMVEASVGFLKRTLGP